MHLPARNFLAALFIFEVLNFLLLHNRRVKPEESGPDRFRHKGPDSPEDKRLLLERDFNFCFCCKVNLLVFFNNLNNMRIFQQATFYFDSLTLTRSYDSLCCCVIRQQAVSLVLRRNISKDVFFFFCTVLQYEQLIFIQTGNTP